MTTMIDHALTQLGILADSGAAALVAAMATDLWDGVRDRAAAALGACDPARTELQSAALDRARQRLVAAEVGPASLSAELSAGVRQALLQDPEILLGFRRFLQETAGDASVPRVRQSARANRNGVVLQAGRDIGLLAR